MKIGIDVSQIVYGTGVSRYTRELVRHLLLLDRENEYVLFAGVWRQKEAIGTFFNELKREGLTFSPKVSFLPPRAADLVFNRLRIPVDLYTGRLDVFHASNWTTPRTKAKLVTTVHDLTPILYPETFPASLIKNFQRNLQLIQDTADLVLADCETTKQDLVKYAGLSAERIKTVYLAAGDQFRPVKSQNRINQVKAKYGIRGRYILSVGTQEPRKNIGQLIEAFTQVNDPQVSLVLVGKSGWGEAKDLRLKIKDLRIVETGFVPDEDLPALYSGAEVFVYPSLYEGFGLPVLEAMQSGCPVITSDRSATAEIGGQAAFLVDPSDTQALTEAMREVLASQKMRDSLISEGLKRAQAFSWKKTARQTLEAYQQVVTP